VLSLCRPLPSPPPPPIFVAVASAEAVPDELQEQLLAQEELTRREEALTTREEKAKISENDAERAKAEATRKEYLDKMEAHTICAKHSLGLDKMLGEKKVELDGRERDLGLREVALVEAQSRGLNPRDNHEELIEFVELRMLLKDIKVEHVAEAERLAILARDVSKVLVALGKPPVLGIPWDPCMADNILEVMGIILERLWEDYTSGHAPWD
jgi:hypothetical protein